MDRDYFPNRLIFIHNLALRVRPKADEPKAGRHRRVSGTAIAFNGSCSSAE
jgi:hypothetical protein